MEKLKAKRVCHVVQRLNAASFYESLRDGIERKDFATGGVMDDEYAWDVAR